MVTVSDESWIGMYLRLSMADGDLKEGDKDESNSIENQRELLYRYIAEQEDLIGNVKEYVDDGYSGTNFNRPAFRRMIEDAKKGLVKVIITKDLSRLGRDYIGVGDYLEQVFPVLGVRYIAVNSNYDSKNYSGTTMGLDVQVNNLVNHLYSRDISKKIKSALQTKWKQGKSTTSRVPFGYRKDEKAMGGWAIDPEAAEIVRTIFNKALDGLGTKEISEYLNENGYVTPGVYRERNKDCFGRRIVPDSEALWDTGKVRCILGKYEYTGAYVHHYREKVQVGSTITRKVPERDRVITEDAHIAIVSREEFKAAQDAIRFMKKADYKVTGTYLLRGKVRCGNCHLIMAHHELAYDGVFYCGHKLKSGEQSNCCGEYISEKKIERMVFVSLRQQLWQIQSLRDQIEEQERPEQRAVRRFQRSIHSQIDEKQAERVRQYIAYAEGVISLEKYLSVKETLTQQIEELQAKANEMRAQEQENDDLNKESKQLFENVEKSIGADKLTKQMVDIFVDAVYVYDPDHIEVVFSFEDCLKRLTTIEKRCDYEAG